MNGERVRLPKRRVAQWAVLILLVLVVWPIGLMLVTAVRAAEPGRIVAALAITLLFVVAPLALLRFLHRFWVAASPSEVAVGSGPHERLVMRLADLESVRVTHSPLGPGLPKPVLVLTGTDVNGVKRAARVSGVLHPGFEPLLGHVADEVARRPEILDELSATEFAGLRRYGA